MFEFLQTPASISIMSMDVPGQLRVFSVLLYMFSSDVDYSGTSTIFVTLPAGTTEECTAIQIIDDSLIEGNETFQIDVFPIFDIGTIISNAVVTIIDDDG